MKAPKARETEGSRAVSLLSTKYGVGMVARKLGITERAVNYIANGLRQPLGPTRKRLAEVFDVEPDSWKRKPSAAPPPASSLEPVPVGSTVAELEANVAALKAAALATNQDRFASARDRTTAAAALTAALKALSRARGDEEISEARIVKSEAFGRVRAAIVEASKGCPSCLERLARVCERLDAEATS